jgi:hypothetical protein
MTVCVIRPVDSVAHLGTVSCAFSRLAHDHYLFLDCLDRRAPMTEYNILDAQVPTYLGRYISRHYVVTSLSCWKVHLRKLPSNITVVVCGSRAHSFPSGLRFSRIFTAWDVAGMMLNDDHKLPMLDPDAKHISRARRRRTITSVYRSAYCTTSQEFKITIAIAMHPSMRM